MSQVYDPLGLLSPEFVVDPATGGVIVPASGATLNFAALGEYGATVEIAPASDLAALTFNLPETPIDGSVFSIRNVTANTVTSVTLLPSGSDTWGGVFTQGLTDGVYVGAFVGYDIWKFRYRVADGTWNLQ